ncbi:MAG: hypothetical protein ACRDUV_06885 [Pseudonocardiaceae bacterium]
MTSTAEQLMRVRNRLAALAGPAGHQLDPRARRELVEAHHYLEQANGGVPWPPPQPPDIGDADAVTELAHLHTDLQALLDHATRLRLHRLQLALAARRVAIAHEFTT